MSAAIEKALAPAELSGKANTHGARLNRFGIPATLYYSCNRYASEHADAIRDALTGWDAATDAATVAAVLEDYRGALTGEAPTARPEQVEKALAACSWRDAARIDETALLRGVLFRYAFNRTFLAEYQQRVKAEPDTDKRRDYFAALMFARRFPELHAAGLYWLRFVGVLQVDDFAGMEPDEIGRVLDFIDAGAPAFEFAQYVRICRDGMGAKPDELAQLTPPELYENAGDVLAYADSIADAIDEILAGVFIEGKQEPAKQSDADIIKIPRKIAAMGSRDLWATFDAKKDGDSPGHVLPIDAIINDYCGRHPNELPVTPYVVQKAVEGVNLLAQIKPAEQVNGIYSYSTTISEFAQLCTGQKDVNNDEKRQLLTALMVVDNLFCVIWTPKGPVAQRLFTLERFGANDNVEMRLHVFASAVHGRPYLIRKSDFLSLTGKGAAAFHFRNQILHKGHKAEKTMVAEVFGYDTAREMAKSSGDASQEAAVKEYQRKHRNKDTNSLLKMFEKAAANGLITYTREQNPAGEWVYKWERVNPPTLRETGGK